MPISAIRSPALRGGPRSLYVEPRGRSRRPGPQRRPVRLRRQRRALRPGSCDPGPSRAEPCRPGAPGRCGPEGSSRRRLRFRLRPDRCRGLRCAHNNSLSRLPLEKRRTAATPTVTSLHVPPYDALRWFVQASPAPGHRITAPPGRISTRGGRTGRPRRPRCFTTASIPPPGRIVRTATAAPSGARGSRPTRARSTRSARRAKPACP